MKRLPTEFDSNRLSQTVATPTCSSCCCCCCCLATTISASTLLGQRINQEAKEKHVPHAGVLTAIAYLFAPIAILVTYLLYVVLEPVFKNCSIKYYNSSYVGSSESYQSCTSAFPVLLAPIFIVVFLFVLWFLYSRVHFEHPLRRSLLIATLILIAFTAEFFGGAALILFTAGAGGIVYLVLVPVISGWITIWYRNHLRKKPEQALVRPIVAPTTPFTQPMEHKDNEPTSQPPTTPPSSQ